MAGDCLVGVLLGGRARRMAGAPKGLLTLPGRTTTILAHLRALCDVLQLECVAVGPTPAYVEAVAGWTVLRDDPAGIGPLGGLGALLTHADGRDCIALACDMPYLTEPMLGRLSQESSQADVLAPRDPESGRWQPLFARYASPRVRTPLAETLQAGERSFQALFGRLVVEELSLSEPQRAALRDWDEPSDIEPAPG